MEVRRAILPIVKKKQDKEGIRSEDSQTALRGTSSSTFASARKSASAGAANMLEEIADIREYDVPYVVRVCIDLHIRAGHYYEVKPTQEKNVEVTFLEEKTKSTKAAPRVLAFDIECTKAPLKVRGRCPETDASYATLLLLTPPPLSLVAMQFPDASHDQIFMISYMVDGQGYLIISRDVVSQDIDDFEYTPKKR